MHRTNSTNCIIPTGGIGTHTHKDRCIENFWKDTQPIVYHIYVKW